MVIFNLTTLLTIINKLNKSQQISIHRVLCQKKLEVNLNKMWYKLIIKLKNKNPFHHNQPNKVFA